MNLNKGHLPFLDGIRGLAILAVFLFHALGASFGFDELEWHGLFPEFNTSASFLALFPLSYGWAGVAIFFVVSGFCIHLSHQKCKERGWGYFTNRRFYRIFPPYLLALALFFFVWPWGSNGHNVDGVKQWVFHFFTIHNLSSETYFGINPSFWSIAVEVQLYAIYPLLLLFTGRSGWKRALVLVGAVELLIRGAAAVNGLVSEQPLPMLLLGSPFAFWLSWTLGAYLCECYLNDRTSRLFSLRFDLLLVLAFAIPLFKLTAPFKFFAFALLTATAVERLMTGKWKLPSNLYFNKIWAHLGILGTLSYSFYLLHQPILGTTHQILEQLNGSPAHPLVIFAACMLWYPLILGLSQLFFRWVEMPSIALGRFMWKRGQQKKAESQAIPNIASGKKVGQE